VSRQLRILAVDAGNSRVKWAMHQGTGFINEGAFTTDAVQGIEAQWSSLKAPDLVMIANVAGNMVEAGLRHGCERWGLIPVFISGKAQECGVTNSYDDPGQLGPDRWAALIAAHALVPGNCLVMCMGTATTVDALTSSGTFLGGLILPGLDMMHSVLASKAARLGPERGEVVSFPRSTRDAITTGAVRATCGAIEHMCGEMQQLGYGDVSIIATGGAAPVFSSLCACSIAVREKLVLQGLVRVGEAMAAQTSS
jgi:type III pantothenate kinase